MAEAVLIARWRIAESETARVLALLAELSEKTRSEPGNVSFEIYQAERDPRELVLHERYVDADAVEAHRASEHYQSIVATQIIPRLESREVISARRIA